jgi:acyl-CoA reductase-like NAD-dependent aldehyde dehydrogenase
MRIFQEEIFGPVLRLPLSKQLKKPSKLQNDTMYGLGMDTMHMKFIRFQELSIRSCLVNQYHSYPQVHLWWYKQSGIGRENHKMMTLPSDENMLISYDKRD